jgi:hypothetical protein
MIHRHRHRSCPVLRGPSSVQCDSSLLISSSTCQRHPERNGTTAVVANVLGEALIPSLHWKNVRTQHPAGAGAPPVAGGTNPVLCELLRPLTFIFLGGLHARESCCSNGPTLARSTSWTGPPKPDREIHTVLPNRARTGR